MRRAAGIGFVILAALILANCSTPQQSLSGATGSVLTATNFTMGETFRQSTIEPKPSTNWTVISSSHRMAGLTGANSHEFQFVAVGSTAYNRCPGRWMATRYPSGYVSSAIQQQTWLLDVIRDATDVDEHGDTYEISPKDAARLLRSSDQIPFQSVKGKDVSLSATVHSGLLRTVTLYANAGGAGIITEKLNITNVGRSPTITVPRLAYGSQANVQGGAIAEKLPFNPCGVAG